MTSTHQQITQPLARQILEKCKQSIIALTAFSATINLLMLVPAFLMLNIYDKAIGSNSVETLLVLVLIAFALYVGLGALEITRTKILALLSSRIDKEFGPRLYDLSLITALATGEAPGSNMALYDLARMRQFLTGTGILAFLDAPWVPIYLIVLFYFDPLLGWLGTLSGALIFTLALLNQRIASPVLQRANHLTANNERETHRVMQNVEVAGVLGMLSTLRDRWEEQKQQQISEQEAGNLIAGTFNGVIKATRIAVQSGALALGAYLALIQEISPGMIIAASIVTGRALQPIEQIVGAWPNFLDVVTRYKRVEDQVNNLPTFTEKTTLPLIRGVVSAQQATVVPPGARVPVLEGIQFTLVPGTVTLIMGPSGSGKSSLVKAILGVWPTSVGHIRIDGAEATSYERELLGPQIGYLPQGIELFDGTVAQNISRFTSPDSEKVINAAKLAGVHNFILSLPQGYDTVIDSKTSPLSPGQAQRIALARAVFGEPKLLVLDEPNSNLDLEGEVALNKAISSLQALGSTVIVVSHRTTVATMATAVVLLQAGRIADTGSFEDIMERNAQQQSPADKRPKPAVESKNKQSVPTVTWGS